MIIALPEPYQPLRTQTPFLWCIVKRGHNLVRIVPKEPLVHIVQLLPRTECHRLRRRAIILIRDFSRVEVRHVLSMDPEIAEVLEGGTQAEIVLVLNLAVVVVGPLVVVALIALADDEDIVVVS